MTKKEIYKKLRDKGYTFQRIADKFGISHQSVQGLLNCSTENYRKSRRLMYAKSQRYRNRVKASSLKWYYKNKKFRSEYMKQYKIKNNL